MSASVPPNAVLVTGAADGIGAAIALRFRRGGYKVHICDNRPDTMGKMPEANPLLRGTVADVGRAGDVHRLFGDAIGWMGGVGVLVNNVGVGGPRAAIEDIDPAAWTETFRVNVEGALLCMQAAIPGMKAGGGGSIVNISTASTRTRLPMRTAYVASKFALEGLTLNGARELGRYGIRCNALLPGVMNNARMDGIIAARADRGMQIARRDRAGVPPLHRARHPDGAGGCRGCRFFLASPAAARITGELISVSGYMGWEE